MTTSLCYLGVKKETIFRASKPIKKAGIEKITPKACGDPNKEETFSGKNL